MSALLLVVALLLIICNARLDDRRQSFARALHTSQASTANRTSSLQIDLGYEIYQGSSNASTGLNVWKGYVWKGSPDLLQVLADIRPQDPFCSSTYRDQQVAGSKGP